MNTKETKTLLAMLATTAVLSTVIAASASVTFATPAFALGQLYEEEKEDDTEDTGVNSASSSGATDDEDSSKETEDDSSRDEDDEDTNSNRNNVDNDSNQGDYEEFQRCLSDAKAAGFTTGQKIEDCYNWSNYNTDDGNSEEPTTDSIDDDEATNS
ncbi:MAG TPA: hypothetical protein VIP70_03520 [Nitrososphaeraceae archaeon]